MITETDGNLLDADTDAVVNTVNTVGVMGKGIALQFKQAYPGDFRAYEAARRRGEVLLGRMFVYETGLPSRPRFIINFPTKQHWRAQSRLSEITPGLTDLRHVIRDRKIESIAIPPALKRKLSDAWTRTRMNLPAESTPFSISLLALPPLMA
jgi:O-acetyl-ADP-ribose deacetylase (regulator of RNase III)